MPPLLPSPTTKPVENTDIVGVWDLENDARLELNEDNTFEISGTSRLDGVGSWMISKDGKQSVRISYEGQVVRIDIIGWVVDTNDGKFAIFGGVRRDPDSWQILKRVESGG